MAIKVFRELRQQVFEDITIPVKDLDTGYDRQVTPVCIITHTGSDLKNGHYVTLEKADHGWLLHDDDRPAIFLENPVEILQIPPFFDPYLVAYEVN